jgi:hypothetical protein
VNRVTTDFQAIRKAADEYGRATQGNRTIRREMLTRDRNDPSCYFNLVFFDSYESAMKNSTPWPLGHLFILAWPVITVMCLAVSAGVRERRAMLDRMTQSRDRRGPGSGRSVSPSHECIFRRGPDAPGAAGDAPGRAGPWPRRAAKCDLRANGAGMGESRGKAGFSFNNYIRNNNGWSTKTRPASTSGSPSPTPQPDVELLPLLSSRL